MSEAVMTEATEAGKASSTSPGSILAAARNERGITIDQLALTLRYAPRQLAALEAGDYAALPGATVVRGMMRAYAKHVGIDPEPLLAQLRTSLSSPPPTVKMNEMSVPFPVRPTPVYRYYILGSLVLILLALLMLGQWSDSIQSFVQGLSPAPSQQATQGPRTVILNPAASQSLSSESVPAVAPTVAAESVVVPPAAMQPPAVQPAAAPLAPAVAAKPEVIKPEPAALPANQKRIVLKFEVDSWVQIRNANDETVMNMLNPAGTERVVTGRPPFNMVIGAATGVRIQYNNAPVDLTPHIRDDVARFTLN
jgi:cytoskeleton protein RodZ